MCKPRHLNPHGGPTWLRRAIFSTAIIFSIVVFIFGILQFTENTVKDGGFSGGTEYIK